MPINVLFVCTGNTCRSAMAEALFRDMIKSEPLLKAVNAGSAGTNAYPGAPMTDGAKTALDILGIKAAEHSARSISSEIIQNSDLILTMEQAHLDMIRAAFPKIAQKAHTLKGYSQSGGCDVEDPFGMPVKAYVECANEIKRALEGVIVRLAEERWDSVPNPAKGTSPS